MDKRQKALDVIAQISDSESSKLTPAMELVADLGIDSPKALQLLVELEETLSLEIPDDAAAKMDTVGDILDYVATA